MRTKIWRILFGCLIFTSALYAQSDLQSKIQRVEQGLLPQVLVKGDPS